MTTKNLQFVPAYYEWHLTDKNGNMHCMADPADEMFQENGDALTLAEVVEFCEHDLIWADGLYRDGEEYNGVYIEEGFTPKEIAKFSDIMATALYNYYIA